jgi:hypothetical protein
MVLSGEVSGVEVKPEVLLDDLSGWALVESQTCSFLLDSLRMMYGDLIVAGSNLCGPVTDIGRGLLFPTACSPSYEW